MNVVVIVVPVARVVKVIVGTVSVLIVHPFIEPPLGRLRKRQTTIFPNPKFTFRASTLEKRPSDVMWHPVLCDET